MKKKVVCWIGLFFLLNIVFAQPRIVCSTFPVYMFTKAIAENTGISIELLVSSRLGCPHSYSMTPQDMRKLAKAQILIINGLGYEEFLEHASTKNMKIIVATQDITFRKNDTHDACTHDTHDACIHDTHDACTHEHGEKNPHVFTSPRLARYMVETIAKELQKSDPDRQELYKKNAQKYIQELDQLLVDMQKVAQHLEKKKIVTQHGIWEYFAQDMGLEIVSHIMLSPGQEPSAAQMLLVLRKIKETGAHIIVGEPQYASKVAKQIADNAHIPFLMLDPVVTGPENPSWDYYQMTMRNNLVILEKALRYDEKK